MNAISDSRSSLVISETFFLSFTFLKACNLALSCIVIFSFIYFIFFQSRLLRFVEVVPYSVEGNLYNKRNPTFSPSVNVLQPCIKHRFNVFYTELYVFVEVFSTKSLHFNTLLLLLSIIFIDL